MEHLIKTHWRSAERIVHTEAYRWYVPEHDHEDILQDTLMRVIRYWKDGKAKDPNSYYLGAVHLSAKTVVMRLKGYHNGDKRPQALKAKGEQDTRAAGLYQPNPDGESMLLDERIIPTVPSAEDVYLATVPNKRQVALRKAIQSLPDRQRTALTHQFYEELTAAESASKMGISLSEVYTLRSNAMRTVKQRLGVNV